ncbi:putative MATE family efflux protein [Rubricella aquisinus]|uniref:Putative MATE family efflux protein n=1 Tax=Rubricella aquisinus TaxID=2028108 RepID=A0A840WTF7_9RHOB|nr:MATE family efflux transporter [Rubricella aquisinus]MBB5516962.1 putative MATE family efflux protein [Rubricella aquisinus]
MSGKERDLTQGSILGHIRAVAIPAALSLLFVTLYNVTDTFYAGKISTEAQAGLGLGSQLFFIIIGTGVGFRIGVSAFVGNAIGAGDRQAAARAAAQAIGASVVVCALAMVAGFWGLPALARAVGGDNAYVDNAVTYMRLMLLSAPGFIVTYAMTGTLSAQGDTVTQERAQLAATLANVGLNPLFIWGIPGVFDGFGLNGIALSTILCQSGVLLFIGWSAFRSDVLRDIAWRDLLPRWGKQKDLMRNVIPACSTIYVTVLGGVIAQFFLRPYGADAVAAYGVGFRLQQLLLLPVIGLTTALLPLTAQNIGAEKQDRIREAVGLTAMAGCVFVALGAVVIWTMGEPLVRLFNDDDAVVAHAVMFLQILSFGLPFLVLIFVSQNLLQGLERPNWPLLIGVWRLGIGLALFGWLFTGPMGLEVRGVWLALLAGGVTGAVLAAIITLRVARGAGLNLLRPADQNH